MKTTRNRPILPAAAFTAALLTALSVGFAPTARAQTAPPLVPAEGRPVAPVPLDGPPPGGVTPLYEIQRVKRTVPMDAGAGLENRWDAVYSVPDAKGKNTVYFNWDGEYVYLGMETPEPLTVRFDLDCRDDGWLRGTDNLTVQVTPPATEINTPEVLVYRYDTVQNRDQPVYAAAPIPAKEVRVRGGRTNRGTFALMVAVPRTEEMGLERKPGRTFGFRCEAAALMLDPATETGRLTTRPMFRLTLADEVAARSLSSLTVRVSLDTREAAPGDSVKAVMEVKNESGAPQRVGKMFLGGSLGSSELLDSSTYASVDLPAGKSLRREIRSSVSPNSPYGALVVQGGFELEDGTKITALSAFDRVEPYSVTLELDKRPVSGASEVTGGDYRAAKIVVRSRVNDRANLRMSLKIPPGWAVEKGLPLTQDKPIAGKGSVQTSAYRVFIPTRADLGTYPIEATVEAGGRTYRAVGTVTIAR